MVPPIGVVGFVVCGCGWWLVLAHNIGVIPVNLAI